MIEDPVIAANVSQKYLLYWKVQQYMNMLIIAFELTVSTRKEGKVKKDSCIICRKKRQ